ncbi:FIG00873367: hypothetical protein [hydrothermal vent metagenome]|uniref:Xylose isomerase-like TIM barrel domain-containing protein n=1 Tax=hydrothermal vent metagenome TaxID=652676 RepID=A0A3B1DHG1_9ZZZZ
MSLGTFPLSYCTNVHPAQTVAQVIDGFDRYTLPIQQQYGKPLAAGLWLAEPVISELMQTSDGAKRLSEELQKRNLICYTLNAFPYGDFHSERVKENVYLPDWSTTQRLNYTINCAKVLATLMPEGMQGSLSTLPLGFKGLAHSKNFEEECIDQLITLAQQLDELYDETGRLIRLAIEPEPCCLLETTAEAISFFEKLRAAAEKQNASEAVQLCIGLCYDVCHQAVEFEEITTSIQVLHTAEIRINKLHISCALHLEDPLNNKEGRKALAQYVEPRYLHQTMAQMADGTVHRMADLSQEFIDSPPSPFDLATAWRIHYHVPVDVETMGGLATTRNELKEAILAIKKLEYAPHLEIETYTWEVLPDTAASLVEGFGRELTATQQLIDDANKQPEKPEPLLII